MAEFLKVISGVRSDMKIIQSNTESIDKLNRQAEQTRKNEEASEIAAKVDSLMTTVNKTSSRITKILKEISAQNKEMEDAAAASGSAGAADVRMRNSQHSTLTKKFVSVMRAYALVQESHKNRIKENMKRQYKIGNSLL